MSSNNSNSFFIDAVTLGDQNFVFLPLLFKNYCFFPIFRPISALKLVAGRVQDDDNVNLSYVRWGISNLSLRKLTSVGGKLLIWFYPTTTELKWMLINLQLLKKALRETNLARTIDLHQVLQNMPVVHAVDGSRSFSACAYLLQNSPRSWILRKHQSTDKNHLFFLDQTSHVRASAEASVFVLSKSALVIFTLFGVNSIRCWAVLDVLRSIRLRLAVCIVSTTASICRIRLARFLQLPFGSQFVFVPNAVALTSNLLRFFCAHAQNVWPLILVQSRRNIKFSPASNKTFQLEG